MIRPIDIRLNAAHPELPLAEAVTYTGAPSTMLIRGVPGNCGKWCITSVYVAATFPDGSTTTRAAVQSANGVWVATLPATNTSGRTANGARIMADGEDENGELVTGYVLGVADFAVASLGVTPAPEPGQTSYPMLYFDSAPSVPRKGDVTKINGALVIYNGTAWEAFTDLTNYYTAAQTDEAIDRIAAYYITYNAAGVAFPTRAALLNAQTYYSGGVARTPTRNDYAVVLADESHDGAEWRYIYAVADGQTTGQWEAQYPVEGVITFDDSVTRTSTNGVKSSGIWAAIWGALTALPTGFVSLYDWVVNQLAGKVPTSRTINSKALSSDVTLTGADVAVSGTDATKINAALAGKLDKSGGEMTGPITHLQVSNDSNRYIGAEKIGLVPVGVGIRRKGEGNLGVVIRLRDGTDREASFYIDDDGKVYINTPNGYVEVPDATNGGTLALTAGTGHTGNLAALDANGNPTDSGKKSADFAPLASPAFTGTPTAPTPTAGDDSTKIATTAFVQGEVGSIKTFQHDAGGYYIEVKAS